MRAACQPSLSARQSIADEDESIFLLTVLTASARCAGEPDVFFHHHGLDNNGAVGHAGAATAPTAHAGRSRRVAAGRGACAAAGSLGSSFTPSPHHLPRLLPRLGPHTVRPRRPPLSSYLHLQPLFLLLLPPPKDGIPSASPASNAVAASAAAGALPSPAALVADIALATTHPWAVRRAPSVTSPGPPPTLPTRPPLWRCHRRPGLTRRPWRRRRCRQPPSSPPSADASNGPLAWPGTVPQYWWTY